MAKLGKTKNPVSLGAVEKIEQIDGIFRKTLAYNNEAMLCYFEMKKGAEIPLHSHPNIQIGFVIRGKIKFITERSEFIAVENESYIFDSNEKHGAKILEDSLVIEVFAPARPEYIP